MTRYSLATRLVARLRGDQIADERDVQRRLARALRQHTSPAGPATQPFAELLTGDEFRRWRSKQLRHMRGGYIPEREAGRYAIVLFLIAPDELDRFLRGRGKSRSAPFVAQFAPETDRQTALAATLAGALDSQPEPLALAPPVLQQAHRPTVTDLGIHNWQLDRAQLPPQPTRRTGSRPAPS